MNIRTITASIAALGLAATAAQAVQAAEADTAAMPITPTPAAQAQPSARQAVRDKATGKLRAPTPEEAAALADAERADRRARGVPEAGAPAPLRTIQHANGMRSAVLGAEYLVTLQARRQADGRLAITHDQPGLDHPAARDVRPTE